MPIVLMVGTCFRKIEVSVLDWSCWSGGQSLEVGCDSVRLLDCGLRIAAQLLIATMEAGVLFFGI